MGAQWPIARILFFLTGFALLMIFVQVTLFHYRQNFRAWPMWIPVIGTPAIGLVTLIATFYPTPFLLSLAGLFLAVGAVAGLVGFYYHYVGVGNRVGGYKMQNFLVGPPVILPLMISAISLVGLVILYWR